MIIRCAQHQQIGEIDGQPGFLHLDIEGHTDLVGNALCTIQGINVEARIRDALKVAIDQLAEAIERAQRAARERGEPVE